MAASSDDIFHSVVMTEEASWNEGFSEGVEMSRKKALEEGYFLGATKGLEIGKEVGFYVGYAAQVINVPTNKMARARIVKVCESIIQLGDKFVDISPMDEALTDNLSKIQSKFKQLTSLLGVHTDYVNVSGGGLQGSSF